MEVLIKHRKKRIHGFINLDEINIEYRRLSDGQITQVSRQIISKKDAVAILLYDPVKRSFVLVQQLRLPAHLNLLPDQKNGVLTEVVAGNIEEGESPEQSAVREAGEETGFQIEKTEKFGQVFSSPGYSTEQIHFYFAEITPEIRKTRVPLRLDGTEDIRIVEWPVDQVRTKIGNGEISDMKTLFAFQWFFMKEI